MKKYLILTTALTTLLYVVPSFSNEQSDDNAVAVCLSQWKKHPFKKEKPSYRVLSSKVKVLGIGRNSNDEAATDKPELVLIKRSVTVLSKSEMSLLNPNGWYCLKGNTGVLGKSVVKLHCDAHLATSSDGASVMAGGDKEGDVTVLGTSRLERVGCKK